MKSLNTANLSAADNPKADIVRLCKIEFSGLTLYLSDGVFGTVNGRCDYAGQKWEPIILDWSTVEMGGLDYKDYALTPGSVEIGIDNNTPIGGADRFTGLFSSYDPHYSTVTISELFVGDNETLERTLTEASDGLLLENGDNILLEGFLSEKIDIFKGQIENLTGMTRDKITIVCSSYEVDLVNKFPITVCNSDDYSGADPDDLGKMLPVVYGSAKKVPAIAIDAGGKTTIAEDMTASSPGNGGTLKLTDASAFPSSGAFVIQVDSEQIQIASRAGNTLTLAAAAARGYDSTTAVAHDNGAPCAEIQTNYYYLVAGHPVKSIDNVYVDNVRVDSGFTAYTGQSGDNDPSGLYDGMAIINFSALPVFTKQVGLDVNDTIAVNDGIGVSDTIAVSTGSHSHGTYNYVQYFAEGVGTNNGVGSPDEALGLNLENFAFMDDATDDCRFTFNSTKDPGGTPDSIKIGIWYNCSGGNNDVISFAFKDSGGSTLTSFNTVAGTNPKDDKVSASWVDISGTTWAEISGGYFFVDYVTYISQVNIYAMWIEVRYTPESSAATGVAKSGSASKTGSATKSGTVTLTGNSSAETVIGSRIAADMDGYQDDTSGTYTGTPSALIERPDHVLYHMLVAVGGLTASQLDIAGSYATSGTAYASNSFALAVVILQRPNFRELINRIAFQSQSIEFWEAGVHHLIYIPSTDSTDKTIEANRVDLNQIWLKYTDRVDILNTFSARYARDWSGFSDSIAYTADELADRATVTGVDSASVSKYGTLETDTYSYPYITTESHAQSVLDWRKTDFANPRIIVEFAGGYYLTDIERGDVLEFSESIKRFAVGGLAKEDNDGILLETGDDLLWESKTKTEHLTDATLGLVTMEVDQFRVIDVSRSKDSIYIKCIAA